VFLEISFQRLDPELPRPEPAHDGDAAFDLTARASVTLEPGERAMIPTGIAVAIPTGYGGLVIPRSGLAARYGISVVNGPGLIDSGFRGEIHVIVVNLGSDVYHFERGDRIAQLMIVPALTPILQEVDELPSSSRGVGGFGSTGR
jgi:dUTP pyrophosphatase